ncbi:MAG: hypothetical protein CBARDCOR_3006 [uncultured Caballeronia sp.]|nr:MAG: hypothetical protein CBARDCOR_3006 [uncultured Caballeronia sp.]
MQDFFMPASVLFAIAGALAFYLAAPGQRWLCAPLPPRLFRTLAGISSLAAFVILSARAGCIAIVFTAAMACLTACPFIGVLLERVPGWRRFAGDTLIVKAERPAKERNTLSRDWLSKTLAGVAGGFRSWHSREQTACLPNARPTRCTEQIPGRDVARAAGMDRRGKRQFRVPKRPACVGLAWRRQSRRLCVVCPCP